MSGTIIEIFSVDRFAEECEDRLQSLLAGLER
jgi:hypothetical protein